MLHPCPACARHVRSGTTSCPFCDARFEARAEAPMPTPPPGLSRAALLAFTALAAAGCSEANAQSRDSGRGLSASTNTSPAAGYGAPPSPSGLVESPPPPSTVTLGPVVAVHPNDARLTATAARTVLRSDVPRVRLCHTRARHANPSLAGTLTVRIEISSTGAVTGRPEVAGIDNAAELVDCVATLLGAQRFPAPHAASVVRAAFLLR